MDLAYPFKTQIGFFQLSYLETQLTQLNHFLF